MDAEYGNRQGGLASVLEILAGVLSLPPGKLQPDAELAECGWDSIAILETFAAVEARFGVELDLRMLRRIHTAGELYRVLRVPEA
jgi:acyl carrier protein